MKALSEYEGAISDYFLVTFLRSDSTVYEVYHTFKGILDALNQDMRVSVLVHHSVEPQRCFEAELLHLINERHQKLCVCEIKFIHSLKLCRIINSALSELGERKVRCSENALLPRTVFSQDPFSVLEGDGDINYILNPIYPGTNFASAYIGPVLSDKPERPSYMLRPCSLSFAGGNILAGDGYILIGEDTIIENTNQSTRDRDDVLKDFQQYYGVEKVISVACSFLNSKEELNSQGMCQPLFHIDLFISLGGPRTRSDGLREEVVFVGKLIAFDSNTGKFIRPDHGKPSEIACGLDTVAADLDGQPVPEGFLKVERIPLILDIVSGNYYSWNNSLVENHWPCPKRRIYLPDYLIGKKKQPLIKGYQNECIETFESFGYEVCMVQNDFGYYAMEMRGSLHCMVKVLRRKRIADCGSQVTRATTPSPFG